MDKNELEKELTQAVYGSRLLIFLEMPETSRFHQLEMTPEQFKKFSDFMVEMFKCDNHSDKECVNFKISDLSIDGTNFEGFGDFYKQ